MARVTYTGIISDLQGSIGGTTFQKNVSGNINRQKPRNSKTGSPNQYISKGLFTSLIKKWNSLSLSDQTDWNVFAAAHDKTNYYNENKTLSGLNWYVSINANLFLCNQALIDVPPVYTLPGSVPDYTITFNNTELSVEFDPSFDHTGESLFIFATPFIRSQSLYNRKQLRLIKIVASAVSEIIDITSKHESYYNYSYPPAGNKFYVLIGIACIHNTSGIASILNLQIAEFT